MSHLDARFATNRITIWSRSIDMYTQESFVLLGSFDATWKNGQRMTRDNDGNEFVPVVFTIFPKWWASNEAISWLGVIRWTLTL